METSYEPTPPVRDRRLWFGVGAGVIVWAIHFFAMYGVVDLVCRWGGLEFRVLGLSGLQFTLLLLTLVAVAVVATAGVISYRHWRELRDSDFAPEQDRYRFMTFSGWVMSVVFAALIVLTFVPAFIVPLCR